MSKNLLTLLSLLLAAGIVRAQNPVKSQASPADLTKMIQSASSQGGASSSSVALKDPVAVVNGEKISKAELQKNFNDAMAASGQANASLTADQKLQGYRQILEGMIMEKLVDKQAASIKLDQADIDAQLAKIKGQFPSEEAFQAELKKSGLTIDQFLANLTRSMRETKWMQSQVAGKDTVTPDDVKKFYDQHSKDYFTHPDLVVASHILFVTPEGATPAQQKEAENKAKAAIVRANKGEDFSKLAAELTEEPGGKQRGGALPAFSKEQMVPEFSNAAFAQKAGTVSATPVKTKFGYHVIKVTDKKPAGTETLDEAKPQILQYLQTQKRRDVFRSVMQELHQSAKIENTLPPAPAAPTSLPLK